MIEEIGHKSDGKPRVAVVILNWNGEKLLREFLPSVIEHTPKNIADVIIADNGSNDGSITFIRESFPDVRLIELEKNYGFAEGYNIVLRRLQADYKYCVLLNSDVAVNDDWLTPLYEFMESHSEAGAVQPKILSIREPGRFEYAGASGGFLDRNGYPYCRGRIFNVTEEDRGQYDEPIQIDWASGAALMVDITLYNQVGGLDKNFFAHMEEIDLCWRMRLSGRQIWVIPKAKVYHLGGGSLPMSDPKKTYLNFRNNLLMLHKNLPVAIRRRKLFMRRILDALAWVKFIVSLDFANARQVINAHRDFAKMRDNLYPEKDSTEGPGVNLLADRPDILCEFYLKRHSRYSQLQLMNKIRSYI